MRKPHRPTGLARQASLGLLCVALAALAALAINSLAWAQGEPTSARITINARKVQGRISPLLYGQFMEFMYEDIKRGLYAELVRNRSFEEPANAIGLSRYWERDPDDRDDGRALKFYWDDSVFYPPSRSFESQSVEHSLRIASPLPRMTASGAASAKAVSPCARAWNTADRYGCGRLSSRAI